MPSSKDIARKLRLAGYPDRDTFRRHYLATALGAVALGLLIWGGLQYGLGPRQYLPRPVSGNHALFGHRCETCHDSFRQVADAACLQCHTLRVHSTNELGTPACADCHTEHRDTEVFLSVSAQSCRACHAELATPNGDTPIERRIDSFATHPEFTVLRDGAGGDRAKLRFHHRIHLTSTQIPENERPLTCARCHQPGPDGRWMEPIVFETHCERCHLQIVDGPAGSIPVPHEEPVVIREELRRSLLDVAASIGTATSEELRRQLEKVAAPSPELLFPAILPGRVARAGFDASRLSVAALETELYAAFIDPDPQSASRYDVNKRCFLCHLEDGTRAEEAELPRILPTAIPPRWLQRSEFSHRRHELMPCESCHRDVRESLETADVSIPGKAECERCHVDGEAESAGTVCMSCHLYHDTSRAGAAAHQDTGRTPAPGEPPRGCAQDGVCPDGRTRLARPTPLPARPWWQESPLDRRPTPQPPGTAPEATPP